MRQFSMLFDLIMPKRNLHLRHADRVQSMRMDIAQPNL